MNAPTTKLHAESADGCRKLNWMLLRRLTPSGGSLRRSTTGHLAASAVATSASSFLVAKAVAVTGGPVQVGVLAAFMGTASLIVALGNVGMPYVFPTQLTAELTTGMWLKASAVVAGASLIMTGCAISLLLTTPIVSLVTGGRGSSTGLVLSASVYGVATLALLNINAAAAQVTSGKHAALNNAVSYSLIAVIAAALVATASAPVEVAMGFGALGALCYLTIAWLRLTVVVAKRSPRAASATDFKAWAFLRKGLGTWGSTVLPGVAWSVVPLFVVASSGLGNAGMFRASLTIGMLLVTFGNVWVAYLTFPQLIRASGMSPAEAQVMNRARQRHLLVLLPMAAVLVAASPLLLILLYAPEFASAWALVPLTAGYAIVQVAVESNLAVFKAKTVILPQTITTSLQAVTLLCLVLSGTAVEAPLWCFAGALTVSALVGLAVSELLLMRSHSPSICFPNRCLSQPSEPQV